MTADISCRSLIQIGLQIPRWRTKWGHTRVWLYLKRLYFISSVIAYCILPYASLSMLGFLVSSFLLSFLLLSLCKVHNKQSTPVEYRTRFARLSIERLSNLANTDRYVYTRLISTSIIIIMLMLNGSVLINLIQ